MVPRAGAPAPSTGGCAALPPLRRGRLPGGETLSTQLHQDMWRRSCSSHGWCQTRMRAAQYRSSISLSPCPACPLRGNDLWQRALWAAVFRAIVKPPLSVARSWGCLPLLTEWPGVPAGWSSAGERFLTCVGAPDNVHPPWHAMTASCLDYINDNVAPPPRSRHHEDPIEFYEFVHPATRNESSPGELEPTPSHSRPRSRTVLRQDRAGSGGESATWRHPGPLAVTAGGDRPPGIWNPANHLGRTT